MHCQRAHVVGGLQPGAALIVVCLAVVTLPSRSTAPAVSGCRLVGCSVVSGLPLRSRIAASRGQNWPQTNPDDWGPFWPPGPRPRLQLPLLPGGGWVWFLLLVGPSYFFMSLALGPLNSLMMMMSFICS